MIYLTGDKGYIGDRLSKKLSDIGYETELCDLKSGKDAMYYEPSGKIETIYHLAAQAGAMPSWEDPIYDARQNILTTIKMCELANLNRAKLIFTTSGAALAPESPYGLSKRTAEEYVKLLCEDYVIVRLSSIYGEKDRGVVDNFIRDKECNIYGDGSAVRDFVHVDDIVDALYKAKDWPKGIYILGSGKGVSVEEVAKATGKEIKYWSSRQGEKKKVVLENTSPNWKPKIDVLEYVRESC